MCVYNIMRMLDFLDFLQDNQEDWSPVLASHF